MEFWYQSEQSGLTKGIAYLLHPDILTRVTSERDLANCFGLYVFKK